MRVDTKVRGRARRLERAGAVCPGKFVESGMMTRLMEAVIERGDIVCVEGDNQKQADFLSKCLARMDPAKVSGLHMVLSTVSLGDQLDVFERGIAERIDFSYSGPLTETCLLGNVAKRVDGPITWGPQSLKITNLAEL